MAEGRRSVAPRPSVLRLPVQLMVAGLLIAAVDVAVAHFGSQPLLIGSVRPLIPGSVMLVGGIALFFWRLLGEES